MATLQEVVNIAKTSSLKRVRSAVVKLQIAQNSMTDVYTDTEYNATMLAVLAEHRGFAIRKMPLKFGTGGLKMNKTEELIGIFGALCDYMVDNGRCDIFCPYAETKDKDDECEAWRTIQKIRQED